MTRRTHTLDTDGAAAAPTPAGAAVDPDPGRAVTEGAARTAGADAAGTAAGPRLAARGLSVGYGGRPVIEGLDLTIPDGVTTTIIGPNGCGKSTLLRAMARLLKPTEGTVLLDGEPVSAMRTKDVARVLGLLPQSPVAPEGLTVGDLVSRGRHPHKSWMRQWSDGDQQQVAEALRMTGISDLAERRIDELSGGQRQRVWISMTLAQGTDIVLLDEPTTFLDLSHAVGVLDLVDRLCVDLGRTIVMVLHDLNLAIRYSDHLVAMRDGAVVASGPPSEIITTDLLRDVFDLTAQILTDPVSGRPLVVPVGERGVRGGDGPGDAAAR